MTPARAGSARRRRASEQGKASQLSDISAQEIVQIYSRSGVDLIWFLRQFRTEFIVVDDLQIRIIILSKDAANSIAPRRMPWGSHLAPTDVTDDSPIFLDIAYSTCRADITSNRQSRLAGAIAHEIGHMFLSRGHAPRGLMRAQFNQSDFRQLPTGELQFTSIEAADIRRSLRRISRRSSRFRRCFKPLIGPVAA